MARNVGMSQGFTFNTSGPIDASFRFEVAVGELVVGGGEAQATEHCAAVLLAELAAPDRLRGAGLEALLGHLRTAYPIGLDLQVLNFQPRTVDGKVREFVVNLLQAIGIVMLVMLVMLGLRTGLVVRSLV